MAKYRKKPVVVEATQWFKHGDHLAVWPADIRAHPSIPHSDHMEGGTCKAAYDAHGDIKTLEGWHLVCPGDWIIRGVKGEFYPCKPDIFEQTYEPVRELTEGGEG